MAVLFNKAEILESLEGDEDILAMILEAYLKDAQRILEDLKSSLDAWDVKTSREHCHTLSGASATVGAETIMELADSIGTAVKSEDSNGAKEAYTNALAEYELFVKKVT